MGFEIVIDGNAILGYELTITDADSEDLLYVYRVDSSGHYPVAAVRGLDFVEPSGGTVVVTDFEAPLNTELVYHAEKYSSTDLETPVDTFVADAVETPTPPGYAILIDVTQPVLRISGSVENLDKWRRQGNIFEKHHVLNRRNPVVTNDIFGGREGNISLTNIRCYNLDYTGNGAEDPYLPYYDTSWETILDSGRTLLFRNSWKHTTFNDCYMKIQSAEFERPHRVSSDEYPIRKMELDYIEVDRPNTSVESFGLTSWQTLLDAGHADWQSVMDTFTDWADLLSDPGRTPA